MALIILTAFGWQKSGKCCRALERNRSECPNREFLCRVSSLRPGSGILHSSTARRLPAKQNNHHCGESHHAANNIEAACVAAQLVLQPAHNYRPDKSTK